MPTEGKVFVSVANRDKRSVVMPVKLLADLGFEIVSTGGTADVLRRNDIKATVVNKVHEAGHERSIVDLVTDGEIAMIMNTPSGGGDSRSDGYEIRAAATSVGTPIITTVAEFSSAVMAIEAQRTYPWEVASLQEHAERLAAIRAGEES
ncbi:hypothetical protein [Pseudoglutamicibacter cumminsii]|uniref:hypothetical protein n=1 Tax=Pseudoglutamicibacter cumminsii TaxID=156979 RepID=UPI003A10222B